MVVDKHISEKSNTVFMLAALTSSCCKVFEQSAHSSYQSSPEQMSSEKSSQLYQPQLQLDAIKKSYQLLGK